MNSKSARPAVPLEEDGHTTSVRTLSVSGGRPGFRRGVNRRPFLRALTSSQIDKRHPSELSGGNIWTAVELGPVCSGVAALAHVGTAQGVDVVVMHGTTGLLGEIAVTRQEGSRPELMLFKQPSLVMLLTQSFGKDTMAL
ncbi:hypothetical protein EYF80_031580 [Liparis tanakae]|uniref:Uncharacterized protein n=1 Tax=Liparis tanakae TaxID=230148 RepID=A0A4Z2GY77_9TELE|nr:hypothetical protein EYF80_031580 [Liparis tanakae]